MRGLTQISRRECAKIMNTRSDSRWPVALEVVVMAVVGYRYDSLGSS